jgi:predicted Zn-dependent protease
MLWPSSLTIHRPVNPKPHSKAATLTLTLPKSREVELEADHIGLILAARACFDIGAASKVRSLAVKR